MQRFSLHSNKSGKGYLLIVQSDHIAIRNTKVVVPLVAKSKFPKPAHRLHPVFRIADQDFIMATHLIAAVPTSEISHRIGSLNHASTEITAALDMLLTGI